MPAPPLHLCTCLLLLFSGIACADATEHWPPLEVIDQPLQGLLNDTEWVSVQAISDQSLTKEGFETLVLCPEALDGPCGLCNAAYQIHLEAPIVVGSQRMSNSELSVRFVHYDVEGSLTTSRQIPASQALLHIDAVDTLQIQGSLAARAHHAKVHAINGHFVARRCNERVPVVTSESDR